MMFTDFVPKKSTQSLIGWSMIAIVGFNICINLLCIFLRVAKKLRLRALRIFKEKEDKI